MATITIKGIEVVTTKLTKIANAKGVEEAINKATELVQGQAKALVPVNTGNLRGSIHPKVIKQGQTIKGKVYTNVSYAPYVEFGTGSTGNGSYPYSGEVDVKLSYSSKESWVYTPDGGETFYRTSGQVAQPYMYPALKRNEKLIKQMISNAIHTDCKNNCK